MALTTKPDVNIAWGDSGTKIKPSNDKISTGWIQEKPPFQFENWSKNRTDNFLKHINEAGIPVWDSTTSYTAGKSYVQGSDGSIYLATEDGAGNDPTSNSSAWKVALSADGAVAHASTADTLATAHVINGTVFDGSADITTARWGYERNISIAGSSKIVNGSTDVSWSREDLGIENVDNTSDTDKPISDATQDALDLKAPINSPTFTGDPRSVTPGSGSNSTAIATTAFVATALTTKANAATTLSGYGITDGVNTSDVVTVATANKILKLDANSKLPASITGNAATATKLQTARTLTIGNTDKSFDGSANVSWSLDEIGAAAETDIGTAPNQVPLNGYLGTMAYQNAEAVTIKPQASATPAMVGEMVFQLTNDTSLVVKVKGSDGVVRSATLTLT